METTRISSSGPTDDGSSSPAVAPNEDYKSWTVRQTIDDLLACDPSRNIMPKHPEYAAYFKEKLQEMFYRYFRLVAPKLDVAFESDGVKKFLKVCNAWGGLLGPGGSLYPDVLIHMVTLNALRCAKVALEGAAPVLRGRRADPNCLHWRGFSALHLAAEMFSVDMVKLLFRYGASANIRTQGNKVIEGLLPLHVAVENASMHKYLEDHWVDGDHIANLLLLLCLPEMKMFLDTTRLIAKQTDNVVDEVWNYIQKEKHVQGTILLLAAQKQLRRGMKKSTDKISLNGFDIIRNRINDALDTLHLKGLALINQGINGKTLKNLKDRKETLLTARLLVSVVQKGGEALEEYIQTNSQVHHEEIVEHVSSILEKNGISCCRKGIDIGKLQWYRSGMGRLMDKSELQRDCGETNDADKSSSDKSYVLRILTKQPPKGLALKEVRNMFFPYWKSVLLYPRYHRNLVPSCESSGKDLLRAEARRNGTMSTDRLCTRNKFMGHLGSTKNADRLHVLNKSMGNLGSIGWAPLLSNQESKRMLCTVASISRKVFKHP